MTTTDQTAPAAARSAKFAEWFSGRSWRVAAELDGEYAAAGEQIVPASEDVPEGAIKISYDHGRFVIAKPGMFQTPLGNKGREGFVLVETGADGADLPGGARACFGRKTLERAVSEYGAIVGLPD